MAFFDALGTGLGLELAAGVGIVVVGVALRNQVREWLTYSPTKAIDARRAEYHARAAAPPPPETLGQRIAQLITNSKWEDWEHGYLNPEVLARDVAVKAKFAAENKCTAFCLSYDSDYHYHKASLLPISTNSWDRGTVRVRDPNDIYTTLDFSPQDQTLINIAFTNLLAKKAASDKRKQDKRLNELLDTLEEGTTPQ